MQQIKKREICRDACRSLLSDERLAYLPRAKTLLEGGLWWKRAQAYERQVDAAFKDYVVGVDEFREMVDGWKAGILKGCERARRIVERRKAA